MSTLAIQHGHEVMIEHHAPQAERGQQAAGGIEDIPPAIWRGIKMALWFEAAYLITLTAYLLWSLHWYQDCKPFF